MYRKMRAVRDEAVWATHTDRSVDLSTPVASTGSSPVSAILWLPLSIGLFAFALRLYGLGDKPFWLDEVATLHRATASLPELVASSLHADHHPTYFLLLWLVAKLGTSQWLLRLPSAVFGALGAVLTYAIGREVIGRRGGAAAGLLMALSPFEVQFAQEARSYTLVSFLILTALWGLVRLANNPPAAAAPIWSKDAPRAAWLAYGLGTAAALDVLNVAIPWLVAANLSTAVIGHSLGNAQRSFWRNWTWVQCGVLTAWLPLLIAIYMARHGAVIDNVGWAWPFSKQTIWSIVGPVYLLRVSNFIVPGTAPATLPVLSTAIIVLVTAGAWRLSRNRVVLSVLSAATLVLPLSLGLVSLFVPVLVPRYFVWGAAPFFMLVGAGLGQFTQLRYAALRAALAVACFINLAPYYRYETKPRWDLVAKELAAQARPGDVVLFNSYYAYWVFSTFVEEARLDEKRIDLTWKFNEAATLTPGHTLWVVYGRTGSAIAETAEEFQASLIRMLGGLPSPAEPVGRFITLWRYPDVAASASATP